MSHIWALFATVLPLLALCSGPESCPLYESSSQNVSPVLESLQCYNDYQSYVHCKWREDPRTRAHTPLELWNRDPYHNRWVPCEPWVLPSGPEKDGEVQCRYNTTLFGVSIKHTFFFRTAQATSCPPASGGPLELSHLLSVHPPVNLSAVASKAGHQLLTWSSPYPTSSSLDSQLTYQLSHRSEGQETWAKQTLKQTHLMLRVENMLPACRYEARVRARRLAGHWSVWSHQVAWQTCEDAGQPPSLQCLLDGDLSTTCTWEVRKDQAHFITYQLACGRNQTAMGCCVQPKVSSIPSRTGALLRYSCSLTFSDPAHLLLELIPTRNAKVFKAHQHIHSRPPSIVAVVEEKGNWIVKWNKPNSALLIELHYQVQYWYTLNQKDVKSQNVSHHLSLTILGASLVPSQVYKVQVRSLLVPGKGSNYLFEGPPSEWSAPVKWSSHTASWSPEIYLYIVISMLATLFCLALFFTMQACQRKVTVWFQLAPSPDKSKLISEIMKAASSKCLTQRESAYITEVQNTDSFSFWPVECSDSQLLKRSMSQDEGCMDYHLTTGDLRGGVTCSETSSVSFDGPYIFCQDAEASSPDSVGEVKDVKVHDGMLTSALEAFAPSSTCFRGSYLFLPICDQPGSSVKFVSHDDKKIPLVGCSEGGDSYVTITPREAGLPDNPPSCTVADFTPWPQGGGKQPLGPCSLP